MESDENFQTNFNIVENYETCLYCETPTENCLGKCEECNHLFCNGLSEENSYSHIIYHLKKSGHRKISLFPHNSVLKCNDCELLNPFDLFVQNNKFYCSNHKQNESVRLVDNDRIINQILPVSTLKTDKERLKNCNFEQMKTRENLISSIETDENIRKIKQKYFDANDYFHTYRPLIKTELEFCKILYETRKEIDIYLRYDNINNQRVCFRIPKSYTGISFIPGKFIIFKYSNNQNFVFYGVISYIDNSTRNIFIYPIVININEINEGYYKIKEQFSEVTFLRMLEGLDYLRDYRDSMSLNLNNAILGIDIIKNYYIGNKIINYIQGYGQLNYKQRIALQKVFKYSLNMIQGPPGTGKTFLASFIIYNIFINKPNEKILVSAPSNDACDNITKKLIEINDTLLNKSKMKILRIVAKGREYVNYSNLVQNISLHRIINKNNYNNPHKFDEANLREIDKYNIIVTTCSTSMDYKLKNFKFPYVIIDEATQSTEMESLLPIIHGANHVTLIGDQNQLRPVTFHPKAQFLGINISLFERMIKIHPQKLIQLTQQYRMHPKLIEFPSSKFYNNTLINTDQVLNNGRVNIEFNKKFNWFNKDIPIMFIHSDQRENLSSSGCSWENESEANLVCIIARKIINCGIKESNIGIITPYLAQKELIEDKLFNYNINNILISSVDSFQGQEKDFIIVSTVRSNLSDKIGFLEDPRRLNVTLTRAKYGLIFIGNAKCLSNSNDHNDKFSIWRNLIKYYQDIKVLCCFNNNTFCPINNFVNDDYNWNYTPESEWDNNRIPIMRNRRNNWNNYNYNFRNGGNNFYFRRNGYNNTRRYY